MSDAGQRYRTAHRGLLVAVGHWRCDAQPAGDAAPETSSRHRIVFTRAGAFRKTSGGRSVVADPATALFFARGEEYRVSHPLPGGDRCVVLTVADAALEEIARGAGRRRGGPAGSPFPAAWAPVDPRSALALRGLLAATARDPLEADERALLLAGRMVRAAAGGAGTPPPAGRPATAALHRRLVERARLVAAERFRERLTLAALGRAAASSPYHLCRLFRRATGLSLHRHVNRLRLLAGLDLLEPGADLARIAHEVGFSSHSHFSTAFRREFGRPPSRVLRDPVPGGRRWMRTILKAGQAPPA